MNEKSPVKKEDKYIVIRRRTKKRLMPILIEKRPIRGKLERRGYKKNSAAKIVRKLINEEETWDRITKLRRDSTRCNLAFD